MNDDRSIEYQKLKLEKCGITAWGYETNRGFTVLRGSQARIYEPQGFINNNPRHKETRDKLLMLGVLVEKGGVYVFTKDYEFLGNRLKSFVCHVLTTSVGEARLWEAEGESKIITPIGIQTVSKNEGDGFKRIFTRLMRSSTPISPVMMYSEKDVVDDLNNLHEIGENSKNEFKASLRWDKKRNCINKDLQKEIIKTIAGFLNADGGLLHIGVEDDGTICGIEDDLKTMNGSVDRFFQTINNLICHSMGPAFSEYVTINFEEIKGRSVCVVWVNESPEPVYVKQDDEEYFYLRTFNSTRKLSIREATKYIRMHWGRRT